MNALVTVVRPAVPKRNRVAPSVCRASQVSFRYSGLLNSGFRAGNVGGSSPYSRVNRMIASSVASANPKCSTLGSSHPR